MHNKELKTIRVEWESNLEHKPGGNSIFVFLVFEFKYNYVHRKWHAWYNAWVTFLAFDNFDHVLIRIMEQITPDFKAWKEFY